MRYAVASAAVSGRPALTSRLHPRLAADALDGLATEKDTFAQSQQLREVMVVAACVSTGDQREYASPYLVVDPPRRRTVTVAMHEGRHSLRFVGRL